MRNILNNFKGAGINAIYIIYPISLLLNYTMNKSNMLISSTGLSLVLISTMLFDDRIKI